MQAPVSPIVGPQFWGMGFCGLRFSMDLCAANQRGTEWGELFHAGLACLKPPPLLDVRPYPLGRKCDFSNYPSPNSHGTAPRGSTKTSFLPLAFKF